MKKKKLTAQQEFDIMKLVLDKFLWLATLIMIFGLWQIFHGWTLHGIAFIFIGCIVLVLFLLIIVREYEVIE